MSTELIIDNGYLKRCETSESTVVIPAEVTCVNKNAFASCPNVHIINLHPEYVKQELTVWVTRCLEAVIDGWDSEGYMPAVPIYFTDHELVKDCPDFTAL